MAVKVRPLHDRIIVERIEEGEQQVGGIIIPDTAKEKPQRGEIVAVGDGKPDDSGNRIALSVAAGDTVLYGKYSGTEVRLDDEDYLIIPEGDILAIIA
jgi:chaperonin GroES